jgi:hypothetical protein
MHNNVRQKEIVLNKKIRTSPKTKKSLNSKTESSLNKQPVNGKDLPLLCTECGNELNLFWLSDKASDKEAVKNNFDNCNQTGKFKGYYCSKMFISGVYTDKVLKKKK